MIDISKISYSVLDKPEVSMFLFHPRKEEVALHGMSPERDIFIPVESNIMIGACFYMINPTAPCILFFHGNGEIVADYHDMGHMYNQLGINFLPVDYRGYGRSDGTPSVTAMMKDCHVIFDFTLKWLKENEYTGPIIIMGRSLGSASALELAANYKDKIDALIIESGFAHEIPLMQLLGINVSSLGFEEKQGFRNIDKITSFDKPLLIIHAQQDHIIPFSDGRTLYDNCQSRDKTFLKIQGANHNNILYVGFSDYIKAIKTLTEKL